MEIELENFKYYFSDENIEVHTTLVKDIKHRISFIFNTVTMSDTDSSKIVEISNHLKSTHIDYDFFVFYNSKSDRRPRQIIISKNKTTCV